MGPPVLYAFWPLTPGALRMPKTLDKTVQAAVGVVAAVVVAVAARGEPLTNRVEGATLVGSI